MREKYNRKLKESKVDPTVMMDCEEYTTKLMESPTLALDGRLSKEQVLKNMRHLAMANKG
jgi:hypothetical protein